MRGKIKFEINFFPVPEDLSAFFTVLFFIDLQCPPGEYVEDTMQPEWAALRITEDESPRLAIGQAPLEDYGPFDGFGPSNQSISFRLGTMRAWGLGLHAAGWARYIDAAAEDLANTVVDARTHPAFARLATALAPVRYDPPLEAEAAGIFDRIRAIKPHESIVMRPILACQEALADPRISGVVELRERVGVSAKSLERLCRRYFGFPPNLLLRRQRFLRSIDHYMKDHSLKWIDAIDGHYHDQAQFIREFRNFMGMSPTEFAEMPHPMLEGIVQHIMVEQGVAEKGTLPPVVRYPQEDGQD